MKLKISVFAIGALLLASSVASAKPPFKKATGLDCKECHIAGKFKEPNADNKLWKSAKDMEAKMKAGKGDFAGKTDCNTCHQGKAKPAKK